MGRTAARWVLVALCMTSAGAFAAPAVELDEVVAELRRDGLPAALAVHKIEEGTAKGVAPDRVLAAVRAVASDLRLMDKIARKRRVRPDARADVISAGVVAHRAGIPLISIDAIVGAASREEPEVLVKALHAAADLGGRGYPRDASAALVLALLRSERRAEELPRALAVVEAARKAGGLDQQQAISKVASRVETGHDLTKED